MQLETHLCAWLFCISIVQDLLTDSGEIQELVHFETAAECLFEFHLEALLLQASN